VLVKELQGLGLKVDLLAENQEIDAEKVLAENIKDEASHAPALSTPADDSSVATVAEDISEEDLASMSEEESPPTAEEIELEVEDGTVNINQEQEEEA
jgi:hypothetical protein